MKKKSRETLIEVGLGKVRLQAKILAQSIRQSTGTPLTDKEKKSILSVVEEALAA